MDGVRLAIRLGAITVTAFAALVATFFPLSDYLASVGASKLAAVPLLPLSVVIALAVARSYGARFNDERFVFTIAVSGFLILFICGFIYVVGVLIAALALSVSEYQAASGPTAMTLAMAVGSVAFTTACSAFVSGLRREFPKSFPDGGSGSCPTSVST